MYEYRLCLYVYDLDVALFHSWLQGIASKSVKISENGLLNPGGCFPKHCRQGDIRPGEGAKNCREDGYMGEEREARQGWFKLCVGGFGTQRTRAAVPHYARAGVALLSGGKGYGNDEKGV